MKKVILSLLTIILFAGAVIAQTPKGFNYQAVVRNSAGQLMANRMVSVRISIMQGAANGTNVYQQTENVSTNGNGLFTLVVGENSEEFANINWARGPYFIVSEIDPNGGGNYTLSTSQKILAVPYAHYATVADRISENFTYDERDPLFREWGYLYDSLRNAPTRLSQFINDLNFLTSNDLFLTLHGDTLFINNNSYVILPHHGDGTGITTIEWDSVLHHPTHLSQFINDLDFLTAGDVYVSGDTLFLNDSTFVIINGGNGPNTIEWDSVLNHPTYLSQFINDLNFITAGDLHLSVSGDTLFLNDSTWVILPNNCPTTIEWDSVLHHPTALSQFYNDLGFITAETQGLSDVIAINNNAYGQIKNLSTPTDPMDAANKAYVDSLLAAQAAALNERIDSITNVYEQRFDSINERIYQLEHPRVKGALPGIFSVSSDKRINFSQGNLQYRPRIKTWRFAVNQYDIAGSDNNNVFMQAYCSTWVDLFGYGTSGWDGGAGRYMPYETTTNNSEYTEATDGNDLVDFYANADWGYYNPIINGGNQMAMWRTLTYSEWTYLLTQRPNANALKGMATVESTPGFILLPDDWTCPAGITFVNTNADYTTNVYNAASWAIMEAAGAVFLPAAGERTGSSTTNIGILGNYWTASHVNGTTGYSFHIAPNSNIMQNIVTYSTGCSVRLVRDY
ncbi:MAG: hypothetical protein IJ785_01460 [Bacteroidales bacterium]|nr:hypothetical protein [Bacteroidales bacterium]